MQDRPTAAELLDAIGDFLVQDVAPHVPPWLTFQLRVARNSLHIIKREIELEEAHLLEEWRGLDALLGDAPRPATLRELRQAVRARNEELCRRIQAGEFDRPDLRRMLVDHLTRTVRDKLLVTNPRYVQ
ncbi:MAG TPA: DUF6285 domain-containing protein [Dehalococcoidia bacterium]